MNWIVAGFFTFVSSVVMYLLVRKATILKVPTPINNLAMFLVPLLCYLLLAAFQDISLSITAYQGLVITILAIFFSYLGSSFSLIALEKAPNPGYSLIISKSYVVFTSLAAVLVFGSELTPKTSTTAREVKTT